MRRSVAGTVVLTAFLAACGGGSGLQEGAEFGLHADVTAFVGVHVVPMDSERVLRDQTVVVREGLIAELGPVDEVVVPREAVVVEGGGRYLMPGLVDAHVHAWSEEHMRLYVANGITTVRNLWGGPITLEWRERTARDPTFVAPSIHTAGPLIDGPNPIWPTSEVARTAEDGRRIVAEHHEAGYDFIKVYNRLPDEAFFAIAEEAARLGMKVHGHVPVAVGLDRALDAGMTGIEHFRGYPAAVYSDELLETIDRDGSGPARVAVGRRILDGSAGVQEVFSEERLQAAIEATLEHDVWNTPTVTVVQEIAHDEFDAWRRSAPARYLSDETIGGWDPSTRAPDDAPDDLRAIEAFDTEAHLYLIRRMHEAGARLVVGTDTPNPWVVPGFAIHDEIDFFQRAGLTPWETLSRATRISAEYVEMAEEIGVVAPGRRADLLLLDGNPLESTSTLRRPAGVMLRGMWLDRDALDRMLEDLEGDG